MNALGKLFLKGLAVTIPVALTIAGSSYNSFFGTSVAVNWRCVNPVDALLDAVDDGTDRIGFVLRTPAEFPVPSADCPSADTNRCELE